VLDLTNNFAVVSELTRTDVLVAAWSPFGTFFAAVGKGKDLNILDCSSEDPSKWKPTATLECIQAGLALAWGPTASEGLQYFAYGGFARTVTVIEIRTHEKAWETVLVLNQEDTVFDLDWSRDGMLAVGLGDGTVSIIDLAYLLSGQAVNQMDYNWQRQGVTCITEIRRVQTKKAITSLRWMENNASGDLLLVVGGSDGIVEIIDLTERKLCRGFQ